MSLVAVVQRANDNWSPEHRAPTPAGLGGLRPQMPGLGSCIRHSVNRAQNHERRCMMHHVSCPFDNMHFAAANMSMQPFSHSLEHDEITRPGNDRDRPVHAGGVYAKLPGPRILSHPRRGVATFRSRHRLRGLGAVERLDGGTLQLNNPHFSVMSAAGPNSLSVLNGAAGLVWHKGELAIAKAAAAVGVPFTLATGSMTAMEKVDR